MLRSSSLPALVIGCTVFVGVPLTAQTQLSLPTHADAVDGHHSLAQPFGTQGFRTQILVEAGSIAPNGAVLNGIAFRTDRPEQPIAAGLVPNVTVELSHTSVAYGGMSTTFATNIQNTPTPVFIGTVNLPATPAAGAGPLPWDIVIMFPAPFTFTTGQGNLLIDITGNNAPTSGLPDRMLDAVQGGGSVSWIGTGGDNPNDFLTLRPYAGSGSPRELSPGYPLTLESRLMFVPVPGFLALGTAPQPVPIDLTPIGAPTNILYVDPLVLSVHSWTQNFFGWTSDFQLPIPSTPTIVGALLYAQSAVFEPAANPLGLVLSSAVEIRIGHQFEQLPLQQLNASDPAAAAGTLVNFSFTTIPDYGSTPIHFDGTFY